MTALEQSKVCIIFYSILAQGFVYSMGLLKSLVWLVLIYHLDYWDIYKGSWRDLW